MPGLRCSTKNMSIPRKVLKPCKAIFSAVFVILASKYDVEAARFTRSESRIVGGVNVTPLNKYSMVVAIQKNGVYQCSGTVLDKYFVLTSGTCIQYATAESKAYVLAGNFKLGELDVQYTQNISIQNVTYHERFNDSTKGFTANDIAVARLSEPLAWSPNVLPTNLPAPNWTVLPNQEIKASAVGWGIGRDGSYPFDPIRPLQEVELIVLTTELCQRANYYFLFNDDQTCTGTLDGRGPCLEDWGGPLFSLNERGSKHIQIGLTSYVFPLCGNSTANSPWPTGYTKISNYVNWIEEVMRQCPSSDASDNCS